MEPVSQNVEDKEIREKVPVEYEESPNSAGPIGIEIGAVANLIASGYSGHVERTYNILDKEVVVTFDMPK